MSDLETAVQNYNSLVDKLCPLQAPELPYPHLLVRRTKAGKLAAYFELNPNVAVELDRIRDLIEIREEELKETHISKEQELKFLKIREKFVQVFGEEAWTWLCDYNYHKYS